MTRKLGRRKKRAEVGMGGGGEGLQLRRAGLEELGAGGRGGGGGARGGHTER